MSGKSDKPLYDVLWQVVLTNAHQPTGNTVHYYGNEKLGTPTQLQIAHFPGDEGFLLLYLDDNGQEMTDTYHSDVSSAMEQANFEFLIDKSDWKKIG